jgi:hypothetical protein
LHAAQRGCYALFVNHNLFLSCARVFELNTHMGKTH